MPLPQRLQAVDQADEAHRVGTGDLVALRLADLHHAGDVHVPQHRLGAATLVGLGQGQGQEQRRRAAAVDLLQVGVHQVGLRAVEQVGLAERHRHRPEADAGHHDDLVERGHRLVSRVRAEHGHAAAERRHRRAGEGGDGDDEVRLELLDDVVDSVDQGQPALRVGVVHLDEHAVARRDDVARERAIHVVGEVLHQHDVERHAALRQEGERRGGLLGAEVVHVHVVHGVGARLAQEAAGVEGDTLADDADGLGARAAAVVVGQHAVGPLLRTDGHRQEAAEAARVVAVRLAVLAALVEGLVEHAPAREADPGQVVQELAHLLGQHTRRRLAGAQVAHAPHPPGVLADELGAGDLLVKLVALATRAGDDVQRDVRLGLAGLAAALDRVLPQLPALDEELDVALGDGLGADEHPRLARQLGVAAQPAAGVARGHAQVVGRQVGLLADVDDDELAAGAAVVHDVDVVPLPRDEAVGHRPLEGAVVRPTGVEVVVRHDLAFGIDGGEGHVDREPGTRTRRIGDHDRISHVKNPNQAYPG